jgi:hypothetical protein
MYALALAANFSMILTFVSTLSAQVHKTVGVDKKISNVPSCTLHLHQQALHETWE